jgi:hypothetical protein
MKSIHFSMYLILPAATGPGVHSASNRNEYQKQKNNVLGSREWPVRRTDNLSAICEPIFQIMWILNISQPYRSPRPVTGIALLCYGRTEILAKGQNVH